MEKSADCPDVTARLLEDVDRALEGASLVPLEGALFEAAHELYEARSDQQRRIVEWFAERVRPAPEPGEPFRVLSIGSGSGILDLQVARDLAVQTSRVSYLGIDPNSVQCRTFARRFREAEGLESVDVDVVPATFEDTHPSGPFDLVHLVQCLYYVADVEAVLRKARGVLAPGGRLLVFHAPRGALNALAGRFYDRLYGRPTLFAHEVAGLCEARGWAFRRERLHAHVDVTPLFGGDPEAGVALRDFIVQVESARLTPAARRAVEAYLEHITHHAGDGRATIPHPVDVFELPQDPVDRVRGC